MRRSGSRPPGRTPATCRTAHPSLPTEAGDVLAEEMADHMRLNASIDNPVGALQQLRGHRDPHRARRLPVDREDELPRPPDRNPWGLGALEGFGDEGRGPNAPPVRVGPVRGEPAPPE